LRRGGVQGVFRECASFFKGFKHKGLKRKWLLFEGRFRGVLRATSRGIQGELSLDRVRALRSGALPDV
jgi:hypothetical protein